MKNQLAVKSCILCECFRGRPLSFLHRQSLYLTHSQKPKLETTKTKHKNQNQNQNADSKTL